MIGRNHTSEAEKAIPRASFAQPEGQSLPAEFLEMLVALDRRKRGDDMEQGRPIA